MGKPKASKAPGPELDLPLKEGAVLETLAQLDATLKSHSAQFNKVLQAILNTKTSLETRIATIATDVTLLQADHRKLTDHVEETESSLAALRPTVQDLHFQLKQMQLDLTTLHTRAEDAEGRSRRNNIRLVGFPEQVESPNTELFVEQWLIDHVLDGKPPKFFSATRLFQSPEDVWTWLHAKGLVHLALDTLEDTTWLSQHSKRRKRKSSKAGPSRAQAVTEQEKAIQETAHFSHNSFLALSDKFQFPSDSDTGATSPSKASGDERAPLMTPRLADDL
ncbi:hypothetical protein NDU88_006741 [Pleurodeles waltl]|uniref:Uncharacterized protein n=1 Tax=Pleurodeles waltl TaxID=8319 RepID=A0AAV7MD38_PLEWA|nr:hypothetical protein NDU88_006741 [Pleurodeles waltl]